MQSFRRAVLLAAMTLPALRAGSINFELGGPCSFLQANPIREEYSALGVHFAAPGGVPGGAVLNQCAGFGIAPRSGTDYLAFSRDAEYADATIPSPSQIILFDTPASNVSLWIAGADANTSYTVYSRNNLGVDMTPVSMTSTSGQWLQVVLPAPNLVWVVLISPSPSLLVDDLTWDNPVTATDNGVPEPGALALTGLGLAALAVTYRRGTARS